MGLLRTMYRGENDINFPRWFPRMLSISGLLVVVSIVLLFTRGLNLAIDFEGGTVWEVPSKTLTSADAEKVLAGFDKADGAKIQVVTDANNNRVVRIQAEVKDVPTSNKVADALAKAAGAKKGDVGVNTVGPSWGKTITRQAVNALAVFIGLIAIYITVRMEWKMAAAALVAMAHDVLLSVGFYSLTGVEVTPATVVAFLTILGFSLYDTIVVFDRVGENALRFEKTGNHTYTALMRHSLNQVIMRSVNTTVVAILPVLAILFVGSGVFGQSVLRDFALALLVGLILGSFSSLFVAAPLVTWLKELEPRFRKVRDRMLERGLDPSDTTWIRGTTGRPPRVTAGTGGPATSTGSPGGAISVTPGDRTADRAARYDRPIPPRPRKQGRTR